MAIVFITPLLEEKIHKKFKQDSIKIFSSLLNLQTNPKKGKEIGSIGNIIIKELKYKNFRFYFITDKYKIKFLKTDELKDLIIKVIRMSNKNNQQKIIDEIKFILKNLDDNSF
ncbi:MAG: hypothetical protein ACOC3Z_00195 [Nanoarchaeota archaeon]